MEELKYGNVIEYTSKCYPQNLLGISNYPKKIYTLGNIELLNNNIVAIVGSRNCTKYGYENAKKFAKELSENGITIVSGLAVGIDSAAHIGAMYEEGRTIAIIGHGFNYRYPESNKELYDEILKNNGCIISEYKYDVEPCSKNFPRRNRLISGISEGVLIVEAAIKSGSTITAKLAIKQKKRVYCIPSNIGVKQGEGTNQLIQGGTKIVLSVSDILKDFGIIKIKEKTININNKKKIKKININSEYLEIYNNLSNIPISINELLRKTKMKIGKINYVLTMMEIEDLIQELPGKEFVIKNND